MLTPSSFILLRSILFSKENNLEKLLYLTYKNEKQFIYELGVLNDHLENQGYPKLLLKDGNVIINKKYIGKYKKLLNETRFNIYELKEDRIYFIYLYIYSCSDFISNAHIQQFIDMSKNTVMIDLGKLKKWISKYNLKLDYSRKYGYEISGDEIAIRYLAELSISKLNNVLGISPMKNVFNLEYGHSNFKFQQINKILIDFFKEYNIKVIQDRIENLIYLLILSQWRINKFSIDYNQDLSDIRLYSIANCLDRLIESLKLNLNNDESIYWKSRFLGIIQTFSVEESVKNIVELNSNIVFNISNLLGIDREYINELTSTLLIHLFPAYYRIKYKNYYENPLLEKIKTEYSELFIIIKKELESLSELIGENIPESEIAYIVIHFGGYISRASEKVKIRAGVVCPNGISSSIIMASTIQQVFPEFNSVETYSVKDIQQGKGDKLDIIFSSIYFPYKKHLFLINPVLNDIEKEVLRQDVSNIIPNIKIRNKVDSNGLIQIIEKYAEIKDKEKLKKALLNYLYSKNDVKKRLKDGLMDFLSKDFIQITDENLNWKDAISLASKPLLDRDYIKQEYIDTMIQIVEDIGPYIVLVPGIALAHARPENGVNKLGMSLLKLNKPTNFNKEGEDNPDRYVSLIFVLAAVDGQAHLDALVQLSKIMDNEESIELINKQKDISSLFEVMNKLVKENEND
ncbi:BglG family transcription antiterminator [Aerococcus tenax]|uniref:BglG family transcription antiterminator n=1 Tax=Aerococcus tenax TaxID=3078812 RepID=UPI0018A7C3F8|nr:BglG family transcription antiterminator [Aerococcus tenax]